MQGISTTLSAILAYVSKLAPLSVLIAAVAFAHNFRQAVGKRNRDEALAIRELFNKLGTKAYLLRWSMVGSPPSLIAAAVLQLREVVEQRIGRSPDAPEYSAFLADQLLSEGLVEKAWRDSKVLEKFQTEALDFGKLRADLGNRIPLVQAALLEIETRLRMLFLLNVFVVFSMRNNPEFKELFTDSGENSAASMKRLHRLLLGSTVIPERGAFSEACEFLERFCEASTTVGDVQVLSIVRSRKLWQRSIDWWDERRAKGKNFDQEGVLLRRLRLAAPQHFELLAEAVMNLSARRRCDRVVATKRRRSAKRIGRALLHEGGNTNLGDCAAKLLAKLEADGNREANTLWQLLELRATGVDDPDIDVFLATSYGGLELLKSAVDRGGSVDATLESVLSRHDIAKTQS